MSVKVVSWHDFRMQASQSLARLVLADGDDPRVVEAATIARSEKIAEPILITSTTPSDTGHWVKALTALPKYKNLSRAEALARVKDPLVLGCLMLREGRVD